MLCQFSLTSECLVFLPLQAGCGSILLSEGLLVHDRLLPQSFTSAVQHKFNLYVLHCATAGWLRQHPAE
jgi:hypothetical protein